VLVSGSGILQKGIGAGAVPAVLIRTFSAMIFVLVMYLVIRGWHFDFTLVGFAFLNLGDCCGS